MLYYAMKMHNNDSRILKILIKQNLILTAKPHRAIYVSFFIRENFDILILHSFNVYFLYLLVYSIRNSNDKFSFHIRIEGSHNKKNSSNEKSYTNLSTSLRENHSEKNCFTTMYLDMKITPRNT